MIWSQSQKTLWKLRQKRINSSLRKLANIFERQYNITHHTSKYLLLRVLLSAGASLIQHRKVDWLSHPCRPVAWCVIRGYWFIS